MVEKGKNGFRPREFVEFDGRMKEMVIIFSSDTEQARGREANRERIARQQGIPMSTVGRFNKHIDLQEGVGSNVVNNRRERGTRGKGRKINYE